MSRRRWRLLRRWWPGRVTLDVSCIGRLYLNGYGPKLQTPGGVIGFFHDHGEKPIVSPALFEPIGDRAFFESLLRENMDLGRPENAELLFRRGEKRGFPSGPPPGGFKTKIDQRCELVTMNVSARAPA